MMARSTCVYVVVGAEDQIPAAGFTVKHELITWLSRQPKESEFEVWRCGDGLSQGAPRVMTTEELVGK